MVWLILLSLFSTHLLIPLLFIGSAWKGKHSTKLDWLITFGYSGAFILNMFLVGRWDWLSYYFRWLIAILFILAVIASYPKIKKLPLNRRRNWKEWSGFAGGFFAFALFAYFTSNALKGFFYREEAVQLSFPLRSGVYYVAHGGGTRIINQHRVSEAQKYALDIVRLNALGTRATGLYPKDLRRYAIYGDFIYSPCEGTISEAVDGLPDNIPPNTDRRSPAGNHVVIECLRIRVVIAHIMQGSLKVQKGDFVKEGQIIGKVGNSGNTSEPHLHIQAVKAEGEPEASILNGEGVPMLFDGKFLVRNHLIFSRK